METPDYISTLPEAEQKALAVCGIYKSAQFSSVSIKALLGDLHQAREYFPEHMRPLSDSRLREIYRVAINDPIENDDSDLPMREDKAPDESEKPDRYPQLVVSHRSQASRKHTKSIINGSDIVEGIHDKAHCINTGRPLRLYIGAWCVILFYLDLIAWFVIPSLMLTGILELNPILVIAGLVAGAVPYFLIARRATCTVCNMRVYDRRNFPKNRYAHNIPLLGHVFSTALHIIFCMWFRCPACGTPQKLIRRSHR